MEQHSSTSKVTVECFDPHDVYKLLSPGLIPRLPLRNLHWQSHAGPLRSIDTLHVELVSGTESTLPSASPSRQASLSSAREDGFQTQSIGGQPETKVVTDRKTSVTASTPQQRRHQIPGLRNTPYLKVLLVRCDDNDSYKATIRGEVREWVKKHTPPLTSSKRSTNNQEKHDAFEWLIVHVVIPSTVASTQPRSSNVNKSETNLGERSASSSSRWRTGSTPLLEKLRSDFNESGKGAVDRICQIRIGVNDVPYDLLPRVVPAVPTGYTETEANAENAWVELMSKIRSLILSSFDTRVTQYEEDIKERDGQRSLPGWNFCTFFILKEGLARGFENVGLVEDALMGYDELSIGLDTVLEAQAETGKPESNGGAMLGYTRELRDLAEKAMAATSGQDNAEEAVDLQSDSGKRIRELADDIAISSTKKAYRDMILENKVSVFDFRCYIFARQVSLLLRLSNALCSREELLAKLKDQQDSVLHGVAPLAPPPQRDEDEPENLTRLAEVCRRTLSFIPTISQIARQDIEAALGNQDDSQYADAALHEITDNIIASFAFSVAEQILAQTASNSLPIPPSILTPLDAEEQKASIPEPKTMMHPARSTSLHVRPASMVARTQQSTLPGSFASLGRRASVSEGELQNSQFLKTGLEELSAKRAELYLLSRSILDGLGNKRGWSNGWAGAPVAGEADDDLVEISLDDDTPDPMPKRQQRTTPTAAGICSHLLSTAVDNPEDYYRLYEILTDKALRHYTVANYDHAVKSAVADLAVLKMHLKDYRTATSLFYQAVPSFDQSGWNTLELSLLIMYSQCLSETGSDEEYCRVALILLTKASAAERERLSQRAAQVDREKVDPAPSQDPVRQAVAKLFTLTQSLPKEVHMPLDSFFTPVEVVGPPEYHRDKDSFAISIALHSLLPNDIPVDTVAAKLSCIEDRATVKEMWLRRRETTIIKPGRNIISLISRSVTPGRYRLDQTTFSSGKLILHHESGTSFSTSGNDNVLKNADIRLFQRRDVLDATIAASKHTALDKNNPLDLTISPGWNTLKSCEVRVKPATGGLRLLLTEAKALGSEVQFSSSPEAGLFSLGDMAKDTNVVIRFPFSVEQDVQELHIKMEVAYVTDTDETFHLSKSLNVPVSLVLGVNVQDVFKHNGLFSRFNVSTASSSPLRLYKSEMIDCELFSSDFGVAPTQPVVIFPKQPATLMYRIQRKPGIHPGKKRAGKTMHLKLYYAQVQTQIESAVVDALLMQLPPALGEWSKVIRTAVVHQVKRDLRLADMEASVLLGRVSLAQLGEVSWRPYFHGMGKDTTEGITQFVHDWCRSHPSLALPVSEGAEPSSIIIPVEVPSLPVVHTADIRLQHSLPGQIGDTASGEISVVTNQMIAATLHLKWTRIWDTDNLSMENSEFSYEVTAPSDAWLVGGRRKGHFVIPTLPDEPSSSPATEAEVPLMLIPQKEGYLAYPNVEIRAIAADGQVREGSCEVDCKNLGESVRVVGGRSSITVSLDASGVGGGPLVLQTEGMRGDRVVA